MYPDYRLAEINEWRFFLNLRYQRRAPVLVKLREHQHVMAGVLPEPVDPDSTLVMLKSDLEDKVILYVFALSDIVSVAEEFSD